MNIKELFSMARNVPLADVIERLGGVMVEPGSHSKYRMPDDRKVVIKQYAWSIVGFDHNGGGAVDLVMALRDCTSREALDWLIPIASSSGPFLFPFSGVAKVEPVKSSPSSLVPSPVDSCWPRVREWLLTTRGLDASIVDSMHANGLFYADAMNNAVFLTHTLTGCELRGTSANKFCGRRGVAGNFAIPSLNDLPGIAVVESAIDAISLRQLGFKPRIISTGGALTEVTIERVKAMNIEVVIAAFDNDEAGDRYSEKLAQAIPGVRRIRPTLKDWNDVLRSKIKGNI